MQSLDMEKGPNNATVPSPTEFLHRVYAINTCVVTDSVQKVRSRNICHVESIPNSLFPPKGYNNDSMKEFNRDRGSVHG